jgi:hypothetical protein
MAEIASALGVGWVLTGTLGKFSNLYQVDLEVVSSRDGTTLSARSGSATSEKAFLETLRTTAHALGRDVRVRLGVPGPHLQRPLRPLAWLPAVAGAALGAVAVQQQAGAAAAPTRW